MTANFTASGGIKIQNEIGNGMLTLSQIELEIKLPELGHRFYRKRAEYIILSRKHSNIKDIILDYECERDAREFIVKNIKGLAYKESSHFLRNVGYNNVAIIDRHILKVLKNEAYLNEIPKSLSKNKYFEIEKILERIGKEVNLSLSELDLYIWYIGTGTVLK